MKKQQKNTSYKAYTITLILVAIVFITLFSLTLTSAETIQYEPNESMELVIKCFDTDSTLCTVSSSCELDIFYPNMTIYQYNKSMTFNNTHFNYTAPPTPLLGLYHATASCHDAVTSGYTSWDFYVGRPSTEVQERTTTRAIYILFGVAVLLFVGYLKVESTPFKWSFFLFSLLFMVMALNIVSISLYDEAATSGVRFIFDQIGAACYFMYWFIGGLLLVIWVMTTIASLADRQRMKQAADVGNVQLDVYR